MRGLTGAQALNKTLKTSPQALRDTAQVAGALLGPSPHDLSKTLRGPDEGDDRAVGRTTPRSATS